ncbi:MAG: acyl-CoA desaturase [Deltaproteobacteria bacterium]|nr:acyl-CoA desaturase [Deltaproteobacteria bacterium]
MNEAHPSTNPRPKFQGRSDFARELRAAVEKALAGADKRHTGGWRIALKSLIVFAWAVGAYLTLILWASSWWLVLLCMLALVLGVAAIGFNVQHDGGHHSYSSRGFANRLAALSLDVVGGSSYVWHHKHNILHHTYPNISGYDDDLEAAPFLRLAYHQRRHWFHRFQHFYAWLIYGGLSIKWQLFDDFWAVIRGRIGQHRMPRPRRIQLAFFVLGKLLFYGWALALPLILHPVHVVLPLYLLCAGLLGIVLAVVFQLAHCVDQARLLEMPSGDKPIPRGFFEHQLDTTVNFANRNIVATWYLGGLNYQIEHHLFPRVSHINYPLIAPVVRAVCDRHGVAYRETPSICGALASHWRFLKRLGRGMQLEAGAAAS